MEEEKKDKTLEELIEEVRVENQKTIDDLKTQNTKYQEEIKKRDELIKKYFTSKIPSDGKKSEVKEDKDEDENELGLSVDKILEIIKKRRK